MENPLVSICIPTYNVEKYIAETLNSLANQSYKNIEIIVSDNASMDRSAEIVQDFAAKDPRIKFLQNKTNIGYVNNINELVDSAASEYIAIYHGDDVYESNIVEKEIRVLLNEKQIGGVFVKHRSFYEDYRGIKISGKYNPINNSGLLSKKDNYFLGKREEYFPLLLKYWNFFICPSFMTRKTVYKESGGFSDKYPTCEDIDLWLKILRKGYSLAILNEILINYRKRRDREWALVETRPELAIYYRVLDDFIKNNNIKLDKNDLINYKINKAKGYIIAAYNAFVARNTQALGENLKRSKEEHLFSPISEPGLCQRIPKIMFGFRRTMAFVKLMIYSIKRTL